MATIQADGSFAGFTPASFAVAGGAYAVEVAGSVSVSVIPASITSFNNTYFLTGNVVVDAVPSSPTIFSDVGVLSGSVAIQTNIAAAFENAINFIGSVPVSVVPASGMIFSDVATLSGDILLAPNVSSPSYYKRVVSLLGQADINFTIGSLLDFENYERITQTPIKIVTASIDETIDSNSGGINPTTDNNTGSIGVTL